MGIAKMKEHLPTVAIALSALFSVSFLWRHSALLFLILAFLSAALLLRKKSVRELKTFIFAAVSGSLAESCTIFFGAWKYSHTAVFNFPVWLPLLWGMAGILMVRAYNLFSE